MYSLSNCWHYGVHGQSNPGPQKSYEHSFVSVVFLSMCIYLYIYIFPEQLLVFPFPVHCSIIWWQNIALSVDSWEWELEKWDWLLNRYFLPQIQQKPWEKTTPFFFFFFFVDHFFWPPPSIIFLCNWNLTKEYPLFARLGGGASP